jgi:hypothetical protein
VLTREALQHPQRSRCLAPPALGAEVAMQGTEHFLLTAPEGYVGMEVDYEVTEHLRPRSEATHHEQRVALRAACNKAVCADRIISPLQCAPPTCRRLERQQKGGHRAPPLLLAPPPHAGLHLSAVAGLGRGGWGRTRVAHPAHHACVEGMYNACGRETGGCMDGACKAQIAGLCHTKVPVRKHAHTSWPLMAASSHPTSACPSPNFFLRSASAVRRRSGPRHSSSSSTQKSSTLWAEGSVASSDAH